VWNCFLASGKSKWTWPEDYELIVQAHKHQCCWSKVKEELRVRHLAAHTSYKDDSLRRRIDTLAKPMSVLHRDIPIPPFEAPIGVTDPKQLRNLEADHNARFLRAQEQQQEARKLFEEILEMKNSVVSSAVETAKQIDNNIRRASAIRKDSREANRNHWKNLSLLEMTRQKACIVHYDRMHSLLERSLLLEQAMVESLIGQPVLLPPPTDHDIQTKKLWDEEILPAILLSTEQQEDEADYPEQVEDAEQTQEPIHDQEQTEELEPTQDQEQTHRL